MISSRIDPVAGSINVSLASITPLEGSFIGDLVELQATVAANATAGATAINLAASSKGGQFTMLNDANLTLIPAPTDADNDSIDGLLTISSLQPSTSEAATVQLIANQLLVTGTNASDRILVATLANGLVRVRAGSQVLGDFAGPTEILIDGLGGSDLISAGTDLPTLISTAANDLEESDLVFGGTTAQWFDDQRFDDQRFDDNGPSSRVNDLALMQLLPQWSNGATSLTPTARPLRLARR